MESEALSSPDVESNLLEPSLAELSPAERPEQAEGGAEELPDPFAQVHPLLAPTLVARGFTELTQVQSAVLEHGAAGRDLQISSQTGSGKTVALGFVLAAALAELEVDPRGPQALIIVPTRELATQVRVELCWLLTRLEGHRPEAVTGGTPIHRDRFLLNRNPRVLVGTPGRLLDHVRSGALDLSGVQQLVLDEADQMLDMGFREELEGILDARPPDSRRTHLVSATFPEGILRLAARYQERPLQIEGTRLGHANRDIEHVGHTLDQNQRYAALVNILLGLGGERTLVFVERRSDAAEVASKLEADGFAALPLSGELVQRQRDRTLASFRDGRTDVLIATDVAARGLDIPDVGTVIHTSPPIDAQVYTHRSGRTGRAGKTGRSILFCSRNRQRRVARLLAEADVELDWRPVPGADEVRALLAERDRKELAESVQTALDAGSPDEHLDQAAALLEGRSAHQVVAALLGKLAGGARAEPHEILQQFTLPRTSVKGERRHDNRPDRRPDPRKRQRPDRPYRDDRPSRYPERGAGRGPDRRPDRRRGPGGDHGSVRFFMNTGTNQGATPGRILAAVCRRGQVDGGAIGSIAIHPNASTFDVRGDAVERFEQRAGRPDPRDPGVVIRRDRGPKAGAKPYRPQHPDRPFRRQGGERQGRPGGKRYEPRPR